MSNSASSPVAHLTNTLRAMRRYPARWAVPTVVLTLLAGIYCVCRDGVWQATQTLVLRNEAANNLDGPGKFRQLEEMKVTQETVLEIAKSQAVLMAALQQVGPAPEANSNSWPSMQDVTALREAITITPPKGSEFGKTEIFYLKVKSPGRERAIALVTAVSQELQKGLRQLRQAKAHSMIDELTRSVGVAEAELKETNARLSNMERSVGSDLGELRMLDVTATGDSDLRRKLAAIENEQREAETARRTSEELLKLLVQAQEDPGHLLATPNRLLESQPSLRRLKDGLIDAQIRSAQALGTMTANHPQAIAAKNAEAEISRRLHRELGIAVRGVDVDLRLTADRLAALNAQSAAIHGRLDRLAALRAEYSSLSSEARHRTSLVEKAQRDLTEARSSLAGADTTSLLSLLDLPETGNAPVGPGTLTILLAGAVGGFLTGVGLVLLSVDMESVDPLGVQRYQRRSTDRAPAVLHDNSSHGGLSLREALAKAGLT